MARDQLPGDFGGLYAGQWSVEGADPSRSSELSEENLSL